jgi:tripartite-type tricarboxylate transporter receptor subunit TctC
MQWPRARRTVHHCRCHCDTIVTRRGGMHRKTTRRHAMRLVLKAVAALFVWLALLPAAALAAYPERPITLIVPWGAGGGTDAVARILGTLMEKDLGQPINVVNRTGGSGVVGHQAISAAPPDGYTIGMITVEIGMMHHQGLTDLNGASYTPIALVNADHRTRI